jgi:sporulation protein YhbH
MSSDSCHQSAIVQSARWYDLFSRGARDWLRHNEKVRDSVKKSLPELVSGPDVLTNPENRSVRVPVKFLEHYRFRLSDSDSQTGVGQGQGAKPGDVLRPADVGGQGDGGAGTGEGGLEFILEFKVDDILDWLWEELELPNLEPKTADSIENSEYVREGIDRRGPRARLDRRRTVKEAVKRRAVQVNPIPFTDDDLRFRQLARRPQPLTQAAIIFILDVSSSMDDASRQLAKSFFFWALQGIRRQHTRIETAFIGHTVKAWEFSEDEFFSVRASGGTEASVAFDLSLEIINERFDPSHYNVYVFYASDGDNFAADREASQQRLKELSGICSFMGYVETVGRTGTGLNTEMGRLFKELAAAGTSTGSFPIGGQEDVWKAIRRFFTHQARQEAEV